MKRFKNALFRLLKFVPPEPGSANAGQKAMAAVQYFYYYLVFAALFTLPRWDFAYERADFTPVWSVAWANLLDYTLAVDILRLSFLATALLGAFFFRHRLARLTAFVGVFQFHAFESSFQSVNHQWYLWVYVALLFVFLPDLWKASSEARERGRFLLIFWGAQAFVLLTYTMSGLGKILGALAQAAAGEMNAFLPEAFALHLAYWMRALQSDTILGPLFVEYSPVGWPFFVGSLYVLLFSFWAAFRPSLHKLWAFFLLLFHIGTFLTMKIVFVPPTLLLLILFLDSPFAKLGTSLRETLSDLPLFGWALRRLLPKSP